MLDVKGSLDNLAWNTEHHHAHIKAQHDFIRIWAIQFELGYSDFRTIQLALQMDGRVELLKAFTHAYADVYQYEYAFAAGGLEGFNQKFGDKMADYDVAAQTLLDRIAEVQKINPAI